MQPKQSLNEQPDYVVMRHSVEAKFLRMHDCHGVVATIKRVGVPSRFDLRAFLRLGWGGGSGQPKPGLLNPCQELSNLITQSKPNISHLRTVRSRHEL